jgi:hypothetical protein
MKATPRAAQLRSKLLARRSAVSVHNFFQENPWQKSAHPITIGCVH